MNYIFRLVFGGPSLDKKEPWCIVSFNAGKMTESEAKSLKDRIKKENPWLGLSIIECPQELEELSEIPPYPRHLFLKMYNLPDGTEHFGLHGIDGFRSGSQEGMR